MATQTTPPDPNRKLDPVEPMPDQPYGGSIFGYPVQHYTPENTPKSNIPDRVEFDFTNVRPPGGGIPFDLDSLDKAIGDLTALSTMQGTIIKAPQSEIVAPLELPDGAEFVRRLMESQPHDARLQFRPGDKVKLTRPDLFGWVPVGAIGEIMHIENPESAMAYKGRHFWVNFDLKPFNMPIAPNVRELLARHMPAVLVPDYHHSVAVHMGALDLEMIEKGANWNPGYAHPFWQDALLNQTRQDNRAQFPILNALERSRRNWLGLGQTPPDDSE